MVNQLIEVLRLHSQRNLAYSSEEPFVRLLPSEAKALIYYIDKLQRMLRSASSTLESKHVPESHWSGELVAWLRADRRQRSQQRLAQLNSIRTEREIARINKRVDRQVERIQKQAIY